MRLEIDVEPFRSTRAGDLDRCLYQLGSDTPPPHRRLNTCVDQEGVNASVPRDIHEADEPAFFEGTDMGKAPCQNR